MGLSVLLVDPYADSREMYSEYFQHHGFVVHACHGSTEAITCSGVLDVIVMAGRRRSEWESEVALIEQLRAAPQTGDVPIILLSGTGSPADALRARNAGCDDVLKIPCSPDKVLETLYRVIARRRVNMPR